jgi:hypothetical protein
LGDLPAARDHFQRALAIYQAQLGPDHPNTVKASRNLADVLVVLGERAKPVGD